MSKNFQIEIAHKSKLSADEWKALGLMMRKLQEQELHWLSSFHYKQTGVMQIGVIFDEMTMKEAKSLFKSSNVLAVARDAKTHDIIGFCAVEEKPELGWATCDGLHVDPKWRRKGIASSLLKLAFDKIKHDGLDSLELRVSLNNKEAQALYKKLGFTSVAMKMEKWCW